VHVDGASINELSLSLSSAFLPSVRLSSRLCSCSLTQIVGQRDLIGPIEGEPFEDIYMILDFMETDLHKIIYSKNELTDEHMSVELHTVLLRHRVCSLFAHVFVRSSLC
jgi:hypothetical protein